MKLYTKRGDDGQTDLFGGDRVSKHDLRVTAYGEVDEANAAIGLTIARCDDAQTADVLRQIQSDLFSLGTELATPAGKAPQVTISDDNVTQLERWIDEAASQVPRLRNFILPGGTETAAHLQSARAVVRRAERAIVALAEREDVSRSTIAYINRLSDLLFALARQVNHRAAVGDVAWAPKGKTPHAPPPQATD
jgi:cob(I)alamin adenosyltransferase